MFKHSRGQVKYQVSHDQRGSRDEELETPEWASRRSNYCEVTNDQLLYLQYYLSLRIKANWDLRAVYY